MAKLKSMPPEAIISGFKGTIDFYYYMGIPCVRRWPRSPGRRRAPLVEAQWPTFAYAAKSWNTLSPAVQQAYRDTASGTSLTGRDLFVKSYITDYFREGQWGSDYPASPQGANFTVIDIYFKCTVYGYDIIAITDIPCHLYLYWTAQEPDKHTIPILRRGIPYSSDTRFCFVSWHKNEQSEAGDTTVHTFYKTGWPVCQLRWITFRAKEGGFWSPSATPIFIKHKLEVQTKPLYVNAPGFEQNIPCEEPPGIDHWIAISPPDQSQYIGQYPPCYTTYYTRDFYSLSTCDAHCIISATITGLAFGNYPYSKYKYHLYKPGFSIWDSAEFNFQIIGDFVPTPVILINNPWTGNQWQATDFDDLQLGISMKRVSFGIFRFYHLRLDILGEWLFN